MGQRGGRKACPEKHGVVDLPDSSPQEIQRARAKGASAPLSASSQQSQVLILTCFSNPCGICHSLPHPTPYPCTLPSAWVLMLRFRHHLLIISLDPSLFLPLCTLPWKTLPCFLYLLHGVPVLESHSRTAVWETLGRAQKPAFSASSK